MSSSYKFRIQFYKSRAGYRWRVKGRNGKIVVAASEGFTSKAKCQYNFMLMLDIFAGQPYYTDKKYDTLCLDGSKDFVHNLIRECDEIIVRSDFTWRGIK